MGAKVKERIRPGRELAIDARTAVKMTLIAFAIMMLCQGMASAAPPHDSFLTPCDLGALSSGGSGDYPAECGTNVDAGVETGEPDHAGVGKWRSVWFRWQAPTTDFFSWDILERLQSFDTILAVYHDTSHGSPAAFSDLVPVAANDDEKPMSIGGSRVIFPATAGEYYCIAVDGYDGASGDIVLEWHEYRPPPNDDLANSAELSSQNGSAETNIRDASWEDGEPAHLGKPFCKSVWFKWVPPVGGPYFLSTHGSNFNAMIAIYTDSDPQNGSVDFTELQFQAGNDDDGSPNNGSGLNFEAVAGTAYYVAVAGVWIEGDELVFDWTYLDPPPPSNDHFADAQVWAPDTGPITVSNRDATTEDAEIENDLYVEHGFKSVWWKWQAPRSGLVTFTADTAYLAVYEGTQIGNLQAKPWDAGYVAFEAQAGQWYYVALGSEFNECGEYTVWWYYEAPQEQYRFDRMWPRMNHPWVFSQPVGLASDGSGNVYVSDTLFHRIHKFTTDGNLIMKWGKVGATHGEFDLPHGIAVGNDGLVYVVDKLNNRIEVFDENGDYKRSVGFGQGGGNGQFNMPSGIALDGSGNLYVVDVLNYRVQKFMASSGQFVKQWGGEGVVNGKFRFTEPDPSDPESLDRYMFHGVGIAVSPDGASVYVADPLNHRVQKFNSQGVWQANLGNGPGTDPGKFDFPRGVAVDANGNVYVTDFGNNRVQRFSGSGMFLDAFGGLGTGLGQFVGPMGIMIDAEGNIWVTDIDYNRVQKFDASMNPVMAWQVHGNQPGEFSLVSGIDLAPDGDVMVMDTNNYRIQRFRADGTPVMAGWPKDTAPSGDEKAGGTGLAVAGDGGFYASFQHEEDMAINYIREYDAAGNVVAKHGNQGVGPTEFDRPRGVAVGADGSVYVADRMNHRIKKYAADLGSVSIWGEFGRGPKQFDEPFDVAVAGDYVYVADTGNHRVQKLSSDEGTFVKAWGVGGGNPGEFIHPKGIATDSQGNVFVIDSSKKDSSINRFNGLDVERIQKFNANGQFITQFGEFGDEAGYFVAPWFLSVSDDGEVFVTDVETNRVQVFAPHGHTLRRDKAVIVAGSGPFPGNNIWNQTQMCANYAYRALLFQGYDKDTIQYLSDAVDMDLDNNGLLDDVDGNATNAGLEDAIINWASDAENLFIYMIGHGGDGVFRMGRFELLDASDLNGWLNQIQGMIPGRVILVYDACMSGSFISGLAPPQGVQRVVLTSQTADREALFQGNVSFSYIFWSHIFNGDTLEEAYGYAEDAMAAAFGQIPQLDANGNAVPNEAGDGLILAGIRLGNETRSASDLPTIDVAGPDGEILNSADPLTVYADNVFDVDGIGRVWAVVYPPGFESSSSEDPVLDLPEVPLRNSAGNRYEGDYEFLIPGTYKISIHAIDKKDHYGIPVSITVTQTMQQAVKGDLDADEAATLADAIIALKVLAGLTPADLRADYATSGVDIDGDDQAGFEEVLYILQHVAELR